MSRTASQWNVNVAPPDLSNVMRMAGRAGRDTGYNQFMEQLLQYKGEQKEADAKQKEEKEAAKEDLGNEPESEGFWKKLGDTASDGLWRTVDIISRFNYASANAAKYVADQDEDAPGEEKNFFEKLADATPIPLAFKAVTGVGASDVADDLELGDIGGALKAGWRGFTGKDKTTFSQVIAANAKKDPNENVFDNRLYQGLAGFAGDVAFDPTTYIGLGLIAKPLKGAANTASKHSEAIRSFSQDASKLNLKIPSNVDEAGQMIPLSADNIYAALGGAPKNVKPSGGRRGRGQAQRTKNVRNYTDNYEQIREAIRLSPMVDTTVGLKNLDETLAQLRKDYDGAVQKYGQRAYNDALRKYVDDAEVPASVGTPEALTARLTERWTESLDLTRASKAINSVNFHGAKNRPSKTAGPAAVKAFREAQEELFDEALGGAWKTDPRISPEFRATALEEVERIAKMDPKYRSVISKIYGAGGIKQRIKTLEDRLEDATDPDTIRSLRSQLVKEKGNKDSGIKGALAHAWEDANLVKANIFVRMVGHHVGDARFQTDLGGEFSDLVAREAEITDTLKNHQVTSNPSSMGEGSSSPRASANTGPQEVKPNVFSESRLDFEATGKTDQQLDEVGELKRELRDLRQRKAELLGSDDFIRQGDELITPEGAPKNVQELVVSNPDGTLSLRPDVPEDLRGWATEVFKDLDLRVVSILNQEIKTWKRRAREVRASMRAPKIEQMFGGSKGNIPKIAINGEEFVKNSPKLKKAIEKLVNDDDIAKYRKESTDAKRKKLPEDKDQFGTIDSGSNSVGDVAGKMGDEIADTGFAAQSAAHNAFDRLFQEQHGLSVGAAIKARKTNTLDTAVPTDYDPRIPKRVKQEMLEKANKSAIKVVNQDLRDGRLKTIVDKSVDLRGERLGDEIPKQVDSVGDAHKVAVKRTKEEYAKQIAAAKVANPRGNSKPAILKEKIKELEEARDFELSMLVKANEEAEMAAEAMAKRMDEQVTLNMLEESLRNGGKNYMRVSFTSIKIADIPVPHVLTAATEKIGGLPILQATSKAWSEAFHPASKLEPELNLARLRAQSRTPDIIKHHVDDIRKTFGKHKPAARKAALHAWVKGAPMPGELTDEMSRFFNDFLPYVQGKVFIDDEPLEIRELNRFLPDEFKLIHPQAGAENSIRIETPEQLVLAMRRLKTETDPIQVMWRLKIAGEQALANKAMLNTIKTTFGVKRTIRKADEKLMQPSVQEELVEKLNTRHGWNTVRDIGEEYYFAPEMADQIARLMDIIKPAKIHEVTRLFDKVLRGWKATVTVYNPGYYTRNGIGETIMGMMDGVVDPRHYTRASRVMRYAQPDEVMESLKTLEPWKRHQTTRQQGAQKVLKLKNGTELTVEDVWVLYHDAGLKSGFVSTEFDHYFPTAGSVKATPVGQVAGKINDTVRQGGEAYEDYFRMAHFISRLERSGYKNPKIAAQDAATHVRKYHYDYTDFTPFEKAVMMRIIPFYKWTRKSLPLMGSMLFTRPGMVSLYPKGMQNLSYGTGGTDPLTDENGFLPNYEEVTPKWMMDLFAYPIGRDEEEAMTYMNVATPQFDVYKMMQNPISATIGMMNPMFKVPLEQATGQTLDPDFNMPLDDAGSRGSHLARTTPIGSLISNMYVNRGEEDSSIVEPGAPLDERLTSFLSGLGFYENSEKRQKGEQLRRNFEGSR